MTHLTLDSFPDWQIKLKLLSAGAWRDASINESKINLWLDNFIGSAADSATERANALHLLSQFIYFGKSEITECLRVLYQDKFVYRHTQQLAKDGKTLSEIPTMLKDRLLKTRYLGIGNPAESGTSFLYHFRKANDLPVRIFSSTCEVISFDSAKAAWQLFPQDLDHIIYLDDFCGTGNQAIDRMKWALIEMKKINPSLKISYHLLFATSDGIDNLVSSGLFDEVEAVVIFDSDYKVFSANSHYYQSAPPSVDKPTAERIMFHYGEKLGFDASDALGYGACQLLLGFCHNTPDNTIPAFWDKQPEVPWHPIFPRANKH